jgi:hypothetical protein
LEILRLLRDARWLTTNQIHRRFFPQASLSAARRRLRKLANSGYIRKLQESRMQEAIFTLGREGKRLCERNSSGEIALVRQPPKQKEHLLGINDLRIAAELAGELEYFFAAWELPAFGWQHPIIPDALMCLRKQSFAFEFDRGLEGIRYFITTKITVYRSGLPGLPLRALLVVADGRVRMDSLARAAGDEQGGVLFTTIDLVRQHGLLAPIFYRRLGGEAETLV